MKKLTISYLGVASILCLIGLLSGFTVQAQEHKNEYASPLQAPETGRSPGVQVKLIGENGETKTYALVFAPGDEILSGLKEFAIKYKVKSAHFTGIGDTNNSKFGWYDQSKKMFKVFQLNEFAEVTSLIGDIALTKGDPAVHAHINLAISNGTVVGGHLLEAFVSPTLEVIVTVQPEGLYKRLEPEFGIMVIDTKLEK